MARSRRDLAILALIETKFRNFTPSYPHHDVFALGKVADLAPLSVEILECGFYAPGIEDGASWRYRNMVILARREALPSLAIRAFHNPEVVSPLWRVPLTRTLVVLFPPPTVGFCYL